MIHFFLLVSRQGKCRLSKWYTPYPEKEKKKMIRCVPSCWICKELHAECVVHWTCDNLQAACFA